LPDKKQRRLYIHSLGCVKNLVDSEMLSGQLQHQFHLVDSAEEADVVVVNSCGFIEDARRESVDAVMEAVALKEQGRLQEVYLMGCLAEYYRRELQREIPELDGLVGTREFGTLLKKLHPRYPHPEMQAPTADLFLERLPLTPSHYSYLRIADGCDNRCTYCTIPAMRGPYRSRPPGEILAEARLLARRGVRELIIIAQEITSYGRDLEGQGGLTELLQLLDQEVEVEWIRLLYTHPPLVTTELLETMARSRKILPYLDFPVEHLSDRVLRLMKRRQTWQEIRDRVAEMRRLMPGISIRTSLITGFPGEREADFQLLLERVAELQLDRLGVFSYSGEEHLPSARLPEQVPEELGRERRDRVMELQREISRRRNQELVGNTETVLVDESEQGISLGRTYRDAPEIDNTVIIKGEFPAGTLFSVNIDAAEEYDLFGTPEVS